MPIAATTATDLIPLRALNQVSYCPRLYYLEYVESLMQTNEFVEDGMLQHRRINDPRLAGRTRQEGDALHTRSVSLSSERLGLTGKLDLVEVKDGECYPVEYKRSAGPSGDRGFWENDAIQLCAQGLLLEEAHGRNISKGILYYIGSKKRVEVPLDESLREKTFQAIRRIRELREQSQPPPPLGEELRHRCHGCSLLTICQPEETLYLLRQPSPLASLAPKDVEIGRVLPATETGAVLYLQEQGSFVGIRGEHLVIRKDGIDLQTMPICGLRQVVVFGNIQVSTQALETLALAEIPVVYLTRYGRFIAVLDAAPRKNVMLRADQYRVFTDPTRALCLARAVVKAKILNQRTLLMRSLRSQRGSNGDDRETHASDEPVARDMAELAAKVDHITDPAVILGTEGQAAHLYFSHFSRLLKRNDPTASFDFTCRNRRPPRDPVNALLSFAYALLVKDCFSAVLTVGFDPYQGFFHAGRHGRPSLALDLMEEFRAIIADSVVLTLINNRMVTIADFLTYQDACQLTEHGRAQFFRAYEQRKATIVKHPVFGYPMSYSRMLEVQARMLASYVRGDVPAYIGFVSR
jgi:CRISPR-associated protein Cas1